MYNTIQILTLAGASNFVISQNNVFSLAGNFNRLIAFFYLHTYIHAYMHTYIHTHTYTYKLMFLSEWREFPSASCFAGKELGDSSRLDIVEIARVPDMPPSLFHSWLG